MFVLEYEFFLGIAFIVFWLVNVALGLIAALVITVTKLTGRRSAAVTGVKDVRGLPGAGLGDQSELGSDLWVVVPGVVFERVFVD